MDCSTFAFDLHVLGTPPALILSQDQTLKLNSLESHIIGSSVFHLCQVVSYLTCRLATPHQTPPLILDGLFVLARSI